jgi:DNA-binding MarR family transcriptional regulator
MTSAPRTSYLIRRAQILVMRNLTDCLRDYNLTPTQYLLLNLSRRGGELSSATLARRFTISPQSMNETIATLEQKQLIVRTVAGEKRRTLHITLTPEGMQLLKTCDRDVDRMEKRLFSALSAAEINSLRNALMKFTGSQSEMREAG